MGSVTATTIAGYEGMETLYESARTVVWRARRQKGQESVIIKAPKDGTAAHRAYAAARYHHEFTLLQRLGGKGAIRAHDLLLDQAFCALVTEDIGARSLSAISKGGEVLELAEVLQLGSNVAALLQEIHDQGVIHKNITPSNLVWNRDRDLVRLIDFGAASGFAREFAELVHPSQLAGTLAYMAPEQTGRMRPLIDGRVDLYGLGATLYELLVGEPVFSRADPLELIYAHLAETPTPPHLRNRAIPAVVSQIILKLLAKSPDERYHSASTLKADLDTCIDALRSSGHITNFALARESTRPRLRQRRYGRSEQHAVLMSSFARASAGSRELVLVSGEPGSGKSTIIEELWGALTHRRALLARGVYEELTAECPYRGLVQALGHLCIQLLGEEPPARAAWRARLGAALAPNGRIATNLIPELGRLLGPQPPLPVARIAQEETRFIAVFRALFRAVSSARSPLILFLDDAHYADAPSLRLLQAVLADPALTHILVVATYHARDPRASAALRELTRTSAVNSRHIELGPLSDSELAQLIADGFASRRAAIEPLVRATAAQTGGNPMFVREVVGELLSRSGRSEGGILLALESDARELDDWLCGKLYAFPRYTTDLLRAAAALGRDIHLPTLSRITRQSSESTLGDLLPALGAGVLVPLPALLAEAPAQQGAPSEAVKFRFAHPLWQSACAALGDERPIHRRIAAEIAGPFSMGDVFVLVAHLRRAGDLLSAGERHELGRRCLDAGEWAVRAQACDLAQVYFGCAEEAIGSELTRDDDLASRLLIGQARAALGCGDTAKAEARLDTLVARERDPRKLAAAYLLRIDIAIAQDRIQEARACAAAALRPFAVAVDAPPAADILLVGIRSHLADQPLTSLAHLPAASDRDAELIFTVLDAIADLVPHCTARAAAELGPLAVQALLHRGSHGLAATGVVLYAIALHRRGDTEYAAQIGRAALAIAERFDDPLRLASACLAYAAYLSPWVDPWATAISYCDHGDSVSWRSGALDLAGTTAITKLALQLIAGISLHEARATLAQMRQREPAHTAVRDALEAAEVILDNLTGRSDGPQRFYLAERSEDELIAGWRQNHSAYALAVFYTMRALIEMLYGSQADAERSVHAAAEHLAPYAGHALTSLHLTVSALVDLRALDTQPDTPEDHAAARLAERVQLLDAMAAMNPHNFEHLSALLSAEIARADSRITAATKAYERAIAAAEAQNSLLWQGFACLRVATLLLRRNQLDVARPYLVQARDLFARWGAAWKVMEIDAMFGDLLSAPRPPRMATQPSTSTTSGPDTTTMAGFDMLSVIKASQLLAKHIVLDDLLRALLRIVFQHAGAERGTLFLLRDGTPVVAAEGAASLPNAIAVRGGISVASWTGGSRAIVHFVHRRGESVVLGHASDDERFSHDPYIQSKKPRSILCMPLVSQGTITGILYLENNIAYDAFVQHRVQILELIAGQMAISVENARLYDALQSALRDARDSDRLKSEFLAVTSHELRTPLNVILNIPELLIEQIQNVPIATCSFCDTIFELTFEQDIPSATPCPKCGEHALTVAREWRSSLSLEEMAPLLREIIDSGRNLSVTVDRILDISHIEAGDVKVDIVPVDTAQLLAEVVQVVGSFAAQRRVSLAVEIADDEDEDFHLHADPSLIRQIIVNLLDNAIKFSHPGGKVEIRAQIREGTTWELSVRDYGIGIPADSQEIIFESFRQVDQSSTREYGGSGLGLAITRKLCELHGGTVVVESAPERGSTFYIRLPLGGPKPSPARVNTQ